MRWPTPRTGPDGAGITNTAPGPATTPAMECGFHDQRSTTAVLAAARTKVAAAASEFGVDTRQLEWSIYAVRESKQADLWRWATVVSLVTTIASLLLRCRLLLLQAPPPGKPKATD